MTADPLMWLAGASALLAVPVLVLSGVFLALFFGGRGERFGRLNDLFTAIGLLLLVAPAAAVYLIARDATGGWLLIVTIAAVGGMALGAIGQFLLILRVIDLRASFVTGGIGVVPVLAWIGITSWLGLAGLFPQPVGWLGAAALVSAALLTVASVVQLDRAVLFLSALLLAAFGGWLLALGRALLGQEA